MQKVGMINLQSSPHPPAKHKDKRENFESGVYFKIVTLKRHVSLLQNPSISPYYNITNMPYLTNFIIHKTHTKLSADSCAATL